MKETNVSEVLIQLRKQNGFTQTELADKLGVSFQAVSKWERGENLPDAYTLLALADVYHVTVDEILRGEIKDKDIHARIKKRKFLFFVSGIAMLVLSPISIFAFGVDEWTSYAPFILVIAAIAITLILYSTVSSDMLVRGTKQDYEHSRIKEIVYTTCVAIFLLLGLVWGLWHPGWIVFLFGYVAVLILSKPKES